MKKTRRIVQIKWLDAKFCPGLHAEEDLLQHKMDAFESLGYLIEQNDKATIFASERNDKGEYRDITLIPSGSVISVHDLITSPSM